MFIARRPPFPTLKPWEYIVAPLISVDDCSWKFMRDRNSLKPWEYSVAPLISVDDGICVEDLRSSCYCILSSRTQPSKYIQQVPPLTQAYYTRLIPDRISLKPWEYIGAPLIYVDDFLWKLMPDLSGLEPWEYTVAPLISVDDGICAVDLCSSC